MEDITNTQRFEKEVDGLEPKTSPSFGKSNFKTFSLLRHQENLISQFESNLQKTLELLNNKSPTNKSLVPSIAEERSFSYATDRNETDSNTKMLETKISVLERENIALKAENKDLQREIESLKSNLNSLTMSKNNEDKEKLNLLTSENEDLKKKLAESQSENENLRSEILKIKTDAFKKYEQLQKNNDELLASYEERFKISMKNLSDKYENEISSLKSEIARLEDQTKKAEQNYKNQKEKLGYTIVELEREKQELFAKINQCQFGDMSTISGCESNNHNASAYIMEQLIKEKHDLERKYDDLFSSYNTILEHNKILVRKLDAVEKEKEEIQRKGSVSQDNSFVESSIRHRSSTRQTEQSVGRIRKNTDKVTVTNTSFTSADEDKLIKSNLRLSEIYPPSHNNSILKPKQNCMNLDDLKNDFSTLEEPITTSKSTAEKDHLKPSQKKPPFASPSVKSEKESRATKDSLKIKDFNKPKESSRTKESAKGRENKENKENIRSRDNMKIKETPKKADHKRSSSRASLSARKVLDSQEIKKPRETSLSKYKSEPKEHLTLSSSKNKNTSRASASRDSFRTNQSSPTSTPHGGNFKKPTSRPGTSSGGKIPVYSKITKKK